MNELTKLTIAEAREGLQDKKFTAVELTKAYAEKMAEGRKYNAYVCEAAEQALHRRKSAMKNWQKARAARWKAFHWALKICSAPKEWQRRLVPIF